MRLETVQFRFYGSHWTSTRPVWQVSDGYGSFRGTEKTNSYSFIELRGYAMLLCNNENV